MKKYYAIFFSILFLQLSINAQDIWEKVNTPFSNFQVTFLASDNDGVLYFGWQDGWGDPHLNYSADNGNTWMAPNTWPGYSVKCMAFNSYGDIFIGTFSNGMLRSTDGGDNFTEINNSLSYLNVWTVLILPNDDILIGGSGGIFRSQNNGDLWEQFGSGLPVDEVEELVLTNDGSLLAGLFHSGIYRSTDNGANWSKSNNGLADTANITAMVVMTNNDILAGVFGLGIFRSTDDGINWLEFNDGTPFKNKQSAKSLSVEDFTVGIDYQLNKEFAFAAVFTIGVLKAEFNFKERADEWINISSGLPTSPWISSLTYTGPNEKLFAGTWDQGLYRNISPIGIEGLDNNHETFWLGDCNPNPVIDVARFGFSIPEQTNVVIKVFNLNGQEVKVLTNSIYSKGSYEMRWIPDELNNGVYFIRMMAGNNIATSKFLLVKK